MKERSLHIILQSIILVLSLWLINQLAEKKPLRIDLTEEGRYSITDATKQILQNLDQEVFFELYLSGDLPSNFDRFQKAIGEMLDQFREESGNRVTYRFTDPSQANTTKARNEFYQFSSCISIPSN